MDRQRSNRRRGAHELVVEPVALAQVSSGGSFSHRVEDEDRAALWAAIDTLPEKLRVVIVLASIEGHDMREVAALLRVPEGTVKSRLFLARQRLKEALR